MRRSSALPLCIALLIALAGWIVAYVLSPQSGLHWQVWIGIGGMVLAGLVFFSFNVAAPWERAVLLRLGTFRGLREPGVFWIIPVVDMIPYWIDIRVLTTAFRAEKTRSRDTVPVEVDAVLFWKVLDPRKAAHDVADYQGAVGWACQTALRDITGRTDLSEMLEGRERIGRSLRTIIDERTEPWGVNVISVELNAVSSSPGSLTDFLPNMHLE